MSFPWELPKRQSTIHYFPEVSSTMDIARDMAKKGCPHFTVVIADRQVKGRGRLQRTWLSEDGGLYFTIVLRPQIPVMQSFKIIFCASLTLVQTIQKLYDIRANVKWPNDILLNEKKICGMLSEIETESSMLSFMNIGIGINVNNEPISEELNAISLRKILGQEVSRQHLLSAFLNEFEKQLIPETLDTVILEWKKYAAMLNRQVKVVTTRDVSEGFAIDVDNDGALILQLNDGTIRKVVYGDCFYNESFSPAS